MFYSCDMELNFMGKEFISRLFSNSNDSFDSELRQILYTDALTSHFQPIYSIKKCSTFGFEALARLKDPYQFRSFNTISDLFIKAKECGLIVALDSLCFFNALKIAVKNGLKDTEAYLFVNVTPEALLNTLFIDFLSEELINRLNIDKSMIIFEITEEGIANISEHFFKQIKTLKRLGYRFAIDDFGAGYGGFKLLSEIEPDFIKIDRHFISGIDKDLVKYNIVDSIVIACHRLGIKVVAEGIERQEELDSVCDLNIDYVQGNHIGKPEPYIKPQLEVAKIPSCKNENNLNNINLNQQVEAKFIGDISIYIQGISSHTTIKTAVNIFIENPYLHCLPVVDDEQIKGMVFRNRFIENHVLGKFGYGIHLNYFKKIGQLMEKKFLAVEYNEPLEQVSQVVQKRDQDYLYDEIVVTKNGKYFGLVPINLLLKAITQRSLILAKGSNPLTGLPGNEAIQREIEKRIMGNKHFDVAYFDINNFKPFNDNYGFERGDYVIKVLADILMKVSENEAEAENIFIGHIGGDDFIMICHPRISVRLCEKVIKLFEERLLDFHGQDDYLAGNYVARNRRGELEIFNLLSLSIAIVSTEVLKIESYAHLASVATEIKKIAKKESYMKGNSVVVKDRRVINRNNFS